MSMVMVELVRRARRRRLGRVLIRNVEWVGEARFRPSLWAEWSSDLPEAEHGGGAANQPPDDREEEWTSAYSVT
jgi:hypothetical protein